ncbi:MAG: hypothetical protein JWM56_622 [Candidatus Peribacteria bacterium]|nr:hypothetical protein [Candidatus Peribacteria bacterium]
MFENVWRPARLRAGAMATIIFCTTVGTAATSAVHMAYAAGEYIVLDVYSGSPGSGLTVTGSGFHAGDSIPVTLQGVTVNATVAEDGSFTSPAITVPQRPAGSYPVIAAIPGGTDVRTAFYINGFSPDASPSEWWLLPGQKLGLSGTNFAPNEDIFVTVGGSSESIATLHADKAGSFSVAGAVTVPLSAAGNSLTYHLTGQMSGSVTEFTVTVGGFFPGAVPSAYFGVPGQTIGVSGSGFSPGETVKLINAAGTELSTVTADGMGNVSADSALKLPYGAENSLEFRLKGMTSGAIASFSISIGGFSPGVVPSAYFGVPGQTIGISGSGFAPDEKVTLLSATDATLFSFTADGKGNVSADNAIKLPFGAEGAQDFRLKGMTSGATVSFSISVGGFSPGITPSTFWALPGQKIGFSGTGFAPDEKVKLTNGAGTFIMDFTADSLGAFEAPDAIKIPLNAKGSLDYTFTGDASKASTTLSLGLGGFDAFIDPDSWYVPPKKAVKVKGQGFAPGESVQGLVDGVVMTTATADNEGAVAFTVKAPKTGGDSHSFIVGAKGADSGASAERTIGLAVECSVDEQ